MIAVPGAGKTTMLTRRVQYLIESRNVKPEQILVLSFANASIEELRTKFNTILGADVSRCVAIRTVHSVALELIAKTVRVGKGGAEKMFKRMVADAIRVATRLPQPWKEYQHLLVDEYQDCSPKQSALIAALAKRIPNILVVGDPMQNLYAFAGSKYTPISDLLSGVRTKVMGYSHRLTRQNAALACAVSSKSIQPAKIETTKRGPRPALILDSNLRNQVKRVAGEVVSLLEQQENAGDIAILARTKAILRPFRAALLARAVRTERIGDHVPAQHAMTIAYMAHKVIQRDIKPLTLKELNIKLGQLELDASALNLAFKKLTREIRPGALEGVFAGCARVYTALFVDKDVRRAILHEANRWVPLCRQFESASALATAIRTNESQTPVMTSTINKAKGREWQYVFLVGVIDGLLPIYHALKPMDKGKQQDKLDEERRLLYVATARASHSLRVFQSPVHHAHTRRKFSEQSRLLDVALRSRVLSIEDYR
ncbi:hypothetical protein RLDS_11305 [Sphingobium lactosutens DS20]|uniref:DNA 3'-5' helicase II n=2 Tax=Sphingobium TaxID=165695 RepID=T0IUG9_9SPHN|nr:hypothetical protein RLDS_11305 [Sphingobium lactosutens DS20]